MLELNLNEFKSFVNKKIPEVKWTSVQAVLALAEEGATVPFMARYRKEKTGNLTEVEIRSVLDEHEKWQELSKRKTFVIEEVEKQGNMTPEFKAQVMASMDLAEVEELYRPFKRKKKTKATMAKEAGLLPLAEWLWRIGQGELQDSTTMEVKAKEFINPTAGYATYDEALRGAQHILVERIYSNLELRNKVKESYFELGEVICKVGKKYKANSKFEKYQDFKETVKSLRSKKASHRYLALRRGWQEGELTVTIEANDQELLSLFETFALKVPDSEVASFMKASAKAALTVHVIPSVVNEIHTKLKEEADRFAIEVFAENVRRVLMASPFGPKVVLGVDPGLRTGCKLALVDNNGRFISSTVIHTHSEEDKNKAKKLLEEVLKQIKIEVVAVGNGTGGREAEVFLRTVLKEINSDVPVILVNESGASIYSASDIAREEFPDLDLTVRGAISIARRLQDPLAELVKIEPKSIGVGQYQHDVSQPELKKSLYAVVESCVNQVGVNLNTASSALLQYVSGIGPTIAKNIVEYRETKGLFKERDELNKVAQFSSRVFQQASGFLRIPEGRVVLDKTGIHPEQYMAVKDMASELGLSVSQLIGEGASQLEKIREKWVKLVGEFTFNDIVNELKKPGLDPRDVYKVFKFREDIHEIKDLQKDMICPGVVTNVTNFGAFVDVGVHQDGLVHLSQISHDFIEDPKLVLSPGDQVQVKVLDVDVEKKQISFSMLLTEKPPAMKPRVSRAESKRNLGAGRGEARSESSGGSRRESPRREGVAARDHQRPHRGDNRGRRDGAREDGEKEARGRRSSHKDSPRGPKSQQPRRSDQRSAGGDRGSRPSKPFNNPFAALGQIKK